MKVYKGSEAKGRNKDEGNSGELDLTMLSAKIPKASEHTE